MPSTPPPVEILVATVLRERDHGDVLELAHQVEELKGSPAWGFLFELIEQGLQAGHRNLENSPPLDAPQYAKLLGYLAGTRFPIEALEAVIAHAKDREQEVAAAEREDALNARSSTG